MSSSPEPSPVNGHSSPQAGRNARIILDDRVSESDLSDVNDNTALRESSSPSSPNNQSPQEAEQDLDSQGGAESTDNDEDNNASDDADFDMEDSPAPSQSDAPHDETSTSNGSRRVPKRKAGGGEDEYIRENPELYGLRRSVCKPNYYSRLLLIRLYQSRPTKQPKIVSYMFTVKAYL